VTTPPATASNPAPGTKPELTHACARCGAPVPLDVGLCERCNPLGLRDVSSSQVHGIAIAGVITFVIILAILAKLALAGMGPFVATIAPAVADATGMTITLSVTNKGTSTGQSTCQVTDPADRTGSTGAFVLTPKIEAGQTLTFSQHVTELGTVVHPLEIECSGP
jgi:hypothetical protein